MRKLSAISFLVLVLFSLVGYQLAIDLFQVRQEAQMEKRIDQNHYSDEDLVIVKLPVNLPYYNNSSTYERVTGAVEVNGTEYKYVKRRIYNDSIELACLPNHEVQKFRSAKDDIVKMNSDLQNNRAGHKATSIKNITLDFCNKLITFSFQPDIAPQGQPFITGAPSLPLSFTITPERPPDFI